ncbi:LytTR family DNA-binding domain-containing protein [Erysipelothrix urinaevulpis]|uniref:LytR/AlgR family response regulator transcription factor n=1 Tax=Erysipelothrix urinaevulpis TaxID=2683717 RepID=UPI0013595EB8|nr:LytTR family DNA-binding domain-containing protein [Erysipelothrix urinaevulpis]
MYNIVLCDDDIKWLNLYKDYIEKFAFEKKISINLDYYESGEKLLFSLSDFEKEIHICIIDIYMDGITGIETAKKMREMGYDSTVIIFSTVSKDHVFEAFDLRSFNYLIKNELPYERFVTVFEEATKFSDSSLGDYFQFKLYSETYMVPLNDISHFESIGRKISIHLDDGDQHEFYDTISNISTSLDEDKFVRIHRSYIVNIYHVKFVHKDHVVLKNNTEVPIGITYKDQLKSRFFQSVRNNLKEIYK